MSDRSSRRHEGPAHLLDINIERNSVISIGRQIYLALRAAIIAGQMPAGVRLPSTREAARLWGVSRGSAVEAFEILFSEGYTTGVSGSGTFVSVNISKPSDQEKKPKRSHGDNKRKISAAALSLVGNSLLDPPLQVAFVTGRAAPDDKTRAILKRIGHRHLTTLSDHYRSPQGELRLRDAVSHYLTAARGVQCEPDRIFITSGSQQAIDLAIRTLIDPGDVVAIEDPSYPPARLAFAAQGAKLLPVPVDNQGINVGKLLGISRPVKAVYVTPSHQYPTGAALPMARRLALIGWAAATGAWIIEDDYDSEFRYNERPLAALQGIDQHERVIYIGTFSKALLPGLRLGYVVVPSELVPAFRAVRVLLDRFPAVFQQLVVADFLSEGYFSSHLRRLRNSYCASRDMLIDLLKQRLAGQLKIDFPQQGIHLLGRFTRRQNDIAVAQLARSLGVTVLPLSPMYLHSKPDHGLILGFAGLTNTEADFGTRQLASVMKNSTLVNNRSRSSMPTSIRPTC